MKKLFAGLWLAVCAGTLAAGQDDDFLVMRQAFQAGDSVRVAKYAQRLKGHVLEPYAAYYQLRPQLENLWTDPEAIKTFLERYKDTPLSDRLKAEWLKTLGRTHQWALFAEEYSGLTSTDTELTCYSLQQRLAAYDASAHTQGRPLWFNARDLPESCTPVFEALVDNGVLTIDDIWARLRLALEAGNVSVAKRINLYLPDDQGLNERKLAAATDNPLRYLETNGKNLKTRADREIAIFALLRLTRSGPDQAYAYWPRIREQFNDAEQAYFMAQLADQAARRLNPRALSWFTESASSSTPVALSDAQLGWKTRAALRAGDWDLVLETIEAMSAQEQQTGVWRYWKARALKAKGRTAEANEILAPLSNEHNFYGQLAEEDLGVTIGAPAVSYKATRQEMAAVERLAGIRRALVLYRLNLRTEAAREWAW
ncbi:MAG TPA: transglycosylase, partial [Nitrosospira sp.]|nr:transglycosylase [Nitrosospira sp.]